METCSGASVEGAQGDFLDATLCVRDLARLDLLQGDGRLPLPRRAGQGPGPLPRAPLPVLLLLLAEAEAREGGVADDVAQVRGAVVAARRGLAEDDGRGVEEEDTHGRAHPALHRSRAYQEGRTRRDHAADLPEALPRAGARDRGLSRGVRAAPLAPGGPCGPAPVLRRLLVGLAAVGPGGVVVGDRRGRRGRSGRRGRGGSFRGKGGRSRGGGRRRV
mmetsp:Transcript_3866/g.12514  ORF Transcript_3866/g.12514 Transcript_3866/m.12514 type:complete len:218 (+) Transcript_3866:146-799(+)